MDRSYLSQPEVIAASRKWVCIRLATYESATEARLLEAIFRGRSGQLENTVFALISSDASKLLATPGRGPRHLYADAASMASGLNVLASAHPARASASPDELPRISDFRLALNVAACEGLPLIVVTNKGVESDLAPASWASLNQGRAVYVRAALDGHGEGAFLVVPDPYGLKAEKVVPLSAGLTAQELSQHLSPWRQAPKDHHAHLRQGHAQGVRWQTRVPVTDPQARY
jgi:hypothetical protein